MLIGKMRALLFALLFLISSVCGAEYARWEIEGSDALNNRNYQLALEIFQRAAEQGEVKASYHIGEVYAYQKDWQQKMDWWLRGAEEGDSTAEFEVAQIFLAPETSGMDFVPQNYVQAYKWFELAVKDPSGLHTPNECIEGRDMAASHMTPAQIKRAKVLVRNWKPSSMKSIAKPNSINGDVKQRFLSLMKKYNVAEYVRSGEFGNFQANPFVYEGRIIAVPLLFSEMLSADRGLFGYKLPGREHEGDVIISGIPRNLFTVRDTMVFLAGKVVGKTPMKTPVGGEVSVPHLRFVGAYICVEYGCAELTKAGL